MNVDKLPLTTLCLITTHKCTSECPNCAFFCNPKIKDGMSVADMIHYIDKSLSLFPELCCLVLTGGEVSCYRKDDICSVIRHACDKGIKNVRIVSNAVWASNFDKAMSYLGSLVAAGLTELNISTGDEHVRFVPVTNVFNAVEAASKCGIFASIALEKHYTNTITKTLLQSSFIEMFGHDLSVQITESAWIEFNNLRKCYAQKDFNGVPELQAGCSNMFTGLQINPSGQLLACCGFAAEFSRYLKLGHIDSYSTAAEYEGNLYNLLNIWLYSEGPKGIVEYINGEKINDSESVHTCEHCLRLLLNPDYMKKVQSIGKAKLKEIILRYEVNRAHHIIELQKQTGMQC